MNRDDLAKELESDRGANRDLDARVAVALYEDGGHTDQRENTHARLPSKSDECAPGTYWISAFSGLSLRTAPDYTSDRTLKRLALAALRTPDGDEVERASITYAPSGLEYAAVDQNDVWLLRFADQDCGDQWFGGDGYTAEEARALAIDAWNRYAPAWSVRLMRTVTLDEVRGAALSAPRPVGEGWMEISGVGGVAR